MRVLHILLFTVILFSSCKKENDPAPPPVAAKTQLDASYGTDALQKMDIYLPSGRTTATTKLIIMVHGGSWNGGDKADLTQYVDTIKRRLPDWAIININYRLANPPNLFPTQELDVKAAIEYIYSKRSEYLISDKFVLLGASAGAHLACLDAYKYTSTVRFKAVVDFFGPTDLADMYNNPANPLVPFQLYNVIGGSPTTVPALYASSNPLNYITAQSAPTIILHGGADVLVSPSQSVMLKNKLTSFGVVNQYVFYPTENHGWSGLNMTDSFDKIAAFLNANVH
ncbi:MAG: alpha/beta hydrolase [Bacteroidetes bacterium]|nr:alpha/beta hydrolase [Bacteroidota bacterium]